MPNELDRSSKETLRSKPLNLATWRTLLILRYFDGNIGSKHDYIGFRKEQERKRFQIIFP